MLKVIISLIFFAYSSVAFSGDSFKFIYAGFDFILPENQSVIGSMGGGDNIIIFRYGDVVGEKYISFTNMTNDENINYGCDAKEFFNDSFSFKKETSCNNDQLTAFQSVFLLNRDYGVWGKEKNVYFSFDLSESIVFVLGKDGSVVKIDSDFLSKEELKDILSNYVSE